MTLALKGSGAPKPIEICDAKDELPKVTGWERNPAGKLAGRFVDLTEYLDPKRYRNPGNMKHP
jgi:ubiquitin-like modifier-activating enzyme ATG7